MSLLREIPELSINMIGNTISKKKRPEKVPKTKKIKKRKKIIPSDNPTTKKGDKSKSDQKVRVGNPFSVARFQSKHNIKIKEAKVRFSLDKPSTNLLLCLRFR